MITGKVTTNQAAIIELEIVGSNRRKEKIEAAIDTGFNYLYTLGSVVGFLLVGLNGIRESISRLHP